MHYALKCRLLFVTLEQKTFSLLTLALLGAKVFRIREEKYFMNKTVKKIAAVALSALMVGSVFAGCSSNSGKSDTTNKNTYNVGICQLTQHTALDSATKGFKDKLSELAKADGKTINFDYQNASNDSANCATIVNKFVSSNYDLILANATPALQAAATATAASKTPVVGTAVTDYGTALDIKMNPTDPTGINITGTSDLAPLADQAQMILDLFPNTKKVGALYCSAEANSQYQVDGVKKALEEKGVSCTFYSFADSNDIATVAKKAASESDVIYVPTDNTAADNGSVIDAACKAAKTPIIAGEEGIFKSTNAVATLSISFYNLGQKAGAMAYEILTKGTDPATMNIQQSDELTYYYNEDQAKAFKANVPDNYKAYNFSDAK